MEGFNHILNWKLLRGSHDFPGKDGGTCINEAAIVATGFEYRRVRTVSAASRPADHKRTPSSASAMWPALSTAPSAIAARANTTAPARASGVKSGSHRALAAPEVPGRGGSAPPGLPGRIGDVLVDRPVEGAPRWFVVLRGPSPEVPIEESLAEDYADEEGTRIEQIRKTTEADPGARPGFGSRKLARKKIERVPTVG